MPFDFDDEQKKAIQKTGKNILVSASAGAGKTGVLVARLSKRCVQDRIPLTRILAMTFTQAAAEEMKKRLARELHQKYRTETEAEKREYLRLQLLSLDNAAITTIDSYCKTIIQKYCNVIGLDPAIADQVLSDSEQEQYRQKAFTAVCTSFSEKDPQAFQRLLVFSSTRPEDTLSLFTLCKTIAAHADSAIDPKRWLLDALSAAMPIAHFADFPKPLLQSFFHDFQLKLEIVQSDLSSMLAYKDQSEKINAELLHQKEILLHNCQNALHEQNYSLFCTSLDTLASAKTSADQNAAAYSKARKHMEDTIKEMLVRRYDEEVLVHDHNDVSPILQDLIHLTNAYRSCFIALKKKDACMDFTDMERYALDILNANDGEIAAILRAQLDEIMVDEFQDTSLLQNTIINRMAKKNNVFRVGDIKQSIYRFRQAKPQLMRALTQSPDHMHIILKHNYRSQESIVRFTNALFSTCMHVAGLQNRYDPADCVSIGSAMQKEDIPVPIIFAKIDAKQEEAESASGKALKSNWIASTIQRKMKENPHLCFRDFAVLIRSHADKTFLRSAFDRYNIPYDIDAREGFYHSQMAQTIRSFVHLLLDPNDMVSFMAVLTSSMYRFTDEDLAQIKIKGGSLAEGMRKFHPDLLQELQELRLFAREHSVIDLLSRIASMHDFMARQNEQERANYDFLFQTVCTSSISTLRQLMTMLDTSQDESSSQALFKGVDDDVVTVATIHHSKGLQYRYVFLWSTMRNPFRDAGNMIVVDDDFHIGAKWFDPKWGTVRCTLPFMAIEHKNNLEDLEEFIRLLYVAVTRAQERLYIVDVIPPTFTPAPVSLSMLSQRKGMSGLLLSVLSESELFQFETVSSSVVEKYVPPIKKAPAHLTCYTGPAVPVCTLATPSGYEAETLPNLADISGENGSDYGTFMHDIIARLPNRLWKKEDFSTLSLANHDIEKLLAFSQSPLYQEALHMDIHKEFPFYVEDGNTFLHGTMDFVALGKDKIILIDFKTDHEKANALRQRYQQQLNAYRHALELIYALPIESYIWSLHDRIAISMSKKE